MEQQIVPKEEWLEARMALLAEEKKLTRLRDEISTKRRQLPLVEVEKEYRFQTELGERTLQELFEGKSQLMVYHFMYAPDWDTGCKSCAFWADNFDGIQAHLGARDISFKVVSNAPLAKILPYKAHNEWTFDWVSAGGSSFSTDFGVSFFEENPQTGYNYTDKVLGQEMAGVSVFVRTSGGGVCHSYSTYSRGLDMLNGAYNYIDLAPQGRNETTPMDWLRRRDDY